MEAYRRGRISKEEALEQLVSIGLTMEYAQSLLDAYETKLKYYEKYDLTRDERSRVRTVLLKMYKEGYIDRGYLEKSLKELMFTDDEIKWTLSVADLEFELDYKEDVKRFILRAYRNGWMDYNTALNELLKLGIRRDRAEVLLALEDVKKKYKPEEVIE